MEILDLLIGELGVNPSHFDIFKTEAEGMLRANLYHRSESSEQVLGLNPHMDGGLLTILLQDDVSGLEVVKDGQWVRVMPHKHAVCINIADMLQVGLSHAAAPAALVTHEDHIHTASSKKAK
jgi:isopenicillin N synthase-like dioxygenase